MQEIKSTQSEFFLMSALSTLSILRQPVSVEKPVLSDGMPCIGSALSWSHRDEEEEEKMHIISGQQKEGDDDELLKHDRSEACQMSWTQQTKNKGWIKSLCVRISVFLYDVHVWWGGSLVIYNGSIPGLDHDRASLSHTKMTNLLPK
ncbi:hypothetical protein RRG08_026255 [Elysia crispata]|uniref:Uncharacterized protein n=1 Tax=Elysia crispata TaxID=231223 RepID=A0AAE0ZAC9_9GAST|nr:hypothetical protein RRG08_026255 [Elysia crispata]